MIRKKTAWRPRANAEARPDAEATVRAGSRICLTTVRAGRRDAAVDPLTEAQILVGVTSWLAASRDWFSGVLDEEDGETVTLRRSDLERARDGLSRSIAHLDGLTVDPAQLPPLDDAPEGAPGPTVPSSRTLQ